MSSEETKLEQVESIPLNKLRNLWRTMPLKEALLDVFKKIKSGEKPLYHYEKIVWVEDAAYLLKTSPNRIREVLKKLFAEEKLDTYGEQITKFVPMFRFPVEIEMMIKKIIADQLGYPTGEGEEIFLANIERVITQNTDFKSGKTAFTKDWPHINPKSLLMFGISFIEKALEQEKRFTRKVTTGLGKKTDSVFAVQTVGWYKNLAKDLKNHQKKLLSFAKKLSSR